MGRKTSIRVAADPLAPVWDEATPPAPPVPVWRQPTLWLMLALLACGVVLLVWLTAPRATGSWAVARLLQLGAEIEYDEFGQEVLEVDLNELPVTDADLAPLAALPRLQRLTLSSTKITDRGVAHLAGLTELRKLHLWRTDIGNAALDHLKDMRHLEELDICATRVDDGGLARLIGLSNLSSLWLEDTNVTDEGLLYLSQLDDLQILSVHGSRVTEEGIAELKRNVPGVSVLYRVQR